MNSILSVTLLALAAAGARAEVKQEAFTAAGDTCKALGGSKCTSGAKLVTKVATGEATATIVRGEGDDGTSLGFVLEAGGTKLLSPLVTEDVQDCAMGSCYAMTATPKLRAVTVNGSPAIALEVDAVWKRTSSQTGKVMLSWTTHHFVVCGSPEKGWTCVTAQFGERGEPCTASLSKTGELKHRCTKTDELAF